MLEAISFRELLLTKEALICVNLPSGNGGCKLRSLSATYKLIMESPKNSSLSLLSEE